MRNSWANESLNNILLVINRMGIMGQKLLYTSATNDVKQQEFSQAAAGV